MNKFLKWQELLKLTSVVIQKLVRHIISKEIELVILKLLIKKNSGPHGSNSDLYQFK